MQCPSSVPRPRELIQTEEIRVVVWRVRIEAGEPGIGRRRGRRDAVVQVARHEEVRGGLEDGDVVQLLLELLVLALELIVQKGHALRVTIRERVLRRGGQGVGFSKALHHVLWILKRHASHNGRPVRIPPRQIPLHGRQMRRHKRQLRLLALAARIHHPQPRGTLVAHLGRAKAHLGLLDVLQPRRVAREEDDARVADVLGPDHGVGLDGPGGGRAVVEAGHVVAQGVGVVRGGEVDGFFEAGEVRVEEVSADEAVA